MQRKTRTRRHRILHALVVLASPLLGSGDLLHAQDAPVQLVRSPAPASADSVAGRSDLIQIPAPAQKPDSGPAVIPLPVPKKVAPVVENVTVKVPGPSAEEFLATLRVPINLPTALRLALSSNLDIAQAREAIERARVGLLRAQLDVIPDLNIGADYTNHQGQIQKTEGNIITVNRDALFTGGGPSLTFQLVDALYGPGVARQGLRASQAAFDRVNEETLLAVGDAYFNVLRVRRRLARINEVLRILTSERFRIEGEIYPGLLPMVQSFIAVGGQAVLRAELYRVEVEILRRREELRAAMQDYQVAVADLARLLRLDPMTPLIPAEDFRNPIPLPGDMFAQRSTAELLRTALNNRPELAENQALVQAAVERVKIAKVRPWLPVFNATYNWGDFGGGPDLNPPFTTIVNGKVTTVTSAGWGHYGLIDHFSPRQDLDVSLIWKFRNLGFGNRAEQREQQAIYRQANWRLLAVQDRVVAQVVATQESILGWRDRLNITRASLFDDKGAPAGPVFTSIRLNFERIRGGAGRPLEVLDSIRSLSDALEQYGQTATDYERAQFRLLIALGMPPQELLNAVSPPPLPVPAAPALQGAIAP